MHTGDYVLLALLAVWGIISIWQIRKGGCACSGCGGCKGKSCSSCGKKTVKFLLKRQLKHQRK